MMQQVFSNATTVRAERRAPPVVRSLRDLANAESAPVLTLSPFSPTAGDGVSRRALQQVRVTPPPLSYRASRAP